MTWNTQPDPINGTPNDPLPGLLNVQELGVVGDGETDDSGAIINALTVSKMLYFPPGTYYLGEFNSSTVPTGTRIRVDGEGGAVHFHTSGKVKFTCDTTEDNVPNMFTFLNATSVYFGPHVEFEDLGYQEFPVTWHGCGCIHLFANDESGPLTNVTIPSIKATNVVLPIYITGLSQDERVTNVNIGIMDCYNTFYGFNAQNQGDNVRVELLRTRQAVRSIISYGCTGHRYNVYSTAMRSTTGDCDIGSTEDGYDTSDFKIKYTARECENANTFCSLQTVGQDRVCKISDVEFDVDIDSSAPDGSVACDWKDYLDPGLAATLNNGPTDNTIDNIRLKGRIDASINFISSFRFGDGHQPTVTPKGKLSMEGDFDLFHSDLQDIKYMDLASDQQAYNGSDNPMWFASVVNPTIGNGVWNNRYFIRDGILEYYLIIVMGSTTTFGTGEYRFGIPGGEVTSGLGVGAEIICGTAKILEDGVAHYVGACAWSDGRSYLVIYDVNGPAAITHASYAWKEGDQITLHARIPLGGDVF